MPQIPTPENMPNIFDRISAEETVRLAGKAAIVIVNMITNRESNFPDNQIHFSSPNMIEAFTHILISSQTFLGMDKFIQSHGDNSPSILTDHLLAVFDIYGYGLHDISIRMSMPYADIIEFHDESTILESGLSIKAPINSLRADQIYMLHALYRASWFLSYFSSSFRTKKQLRTKRESDASNEAVINSAGSLISAQLSLEKGMFNFAQAYGKAREEELLELIRRAEQEQLRKRLEKSQQSKTAGSLPPKELIPFREFAISRSHTIWEAELSQGQTPRSIEQMIKTLRKQFADESNNSIYQSDAPIRKMISPIANKLGIVVKKGRPKKMK